MGKRTAKRMRRGQLIEQGRMIYTLDPPETKIDSQGHIDLEIMEKRKLHHL